MGSKYNWLEIQKLHDDGMSQRDIVKQFGMSFKSIQLATKRGEFIPRTRSEGVKTHRAKSKRVVSAATKKKISESMERRHAEGKAWNIGQSRWNNEPSWPEQFFMQVISNEFDDKDYQREYPFGRFSLDFAWPHLKKYIEIDGDQHQRFDDVKERDARKDKLLADSGWQVHRIIWKEMFADTKAHIEKAKQFLRR
jgi:very-short-patch-repair endonuclease